MNPRPFFKLALPIIGVVTLINLCAMPREEYHGDAEAVRAEAITLLNTGKWAVPREVAETSGARGQYFYQNPNGAWYPKYGVLNTVMYLPPLWLEKIATGRLELQSQSRVLFLNLFNLVLSGTTACYLILLGRRYTKSSVIIALFVFASLFSTFWWNYLRAQTFEIYHALFLLAFFFHFVSALDFSKPDVEPRRTEFHFLGAAIYLGALCLSKSAYLVLLPAIVLMMARVTISGRKNYSLVRAIRSSLFFFLPVCFFLLLFAATNWLKFGSPFATGYTQWVHEQTLFVPSNIFPALWGYVAQPRSSVFVHFPILFFALFGWPRFFSRHKIDSQSALLFGLSLLAINSVFTNWRGEASYGPRYLLPVLPILSLPMLAYLGVLVRRPSGLAKFALGVGTASVLLCSVLLQVCVNTLPFFFCYDLKDILPDPHDSGPAKYLRDRPFAVTECEFLLSRAEFSFMFTRSFVQRLDPEEVEKFTDLISKTRSNYYWFPNLLSQPEKPSR